MKNVTLSFACLIACVTLTKAQTITSSWSPTPWGANQTYVVENTPAISPGAAGQSQTWDFSAVTSDSSYIETIVPPQGQIGTSNFPSATVARIIESSAFSAATYFNGSSSALTYLGSYSEASGFSATNIYSNPVDYIRYPVGFGQSYTDDFDADIGAFGVSYGREGSVLVEVDATGTLTTPFGTYSNVLRVKAVETYQLTGLPPIPGSSTSGVTTTYSYISEQFPGIYLFTYNISDDNIGNLDTTMSYSDPGFQRVNQINDNKLLVFPLPANTLIQFQSNESIHSIALFDLNGREVSTTPFNGASVAELAVSKIPSGIYMARVLYSNGALANKRIVVSH